MPLTDAGVTTYQGREFNAEQMEGRAITLIELAKYLQRSRVCLPEAQAIAADLQVEAEGWSARAGRCRDALTDCQRRTYDHLLQHLAAQGRSPTKVHLAKLDGVTPSTVQLRLKALEKKGFVSLKPNVRDGISVADSPRGGQAGRSSN